MSDEIGLLHAWIDDHRDEMVEALRGALRIPSKKEPPAGTDAPFGRPIRDALDYTLDLSRRLGFRTKDVAGFAGHAEFAEGSEMVAALGHLDVVPEGDRWRHAPFGAEIDDGFIYARGAADDKGPIYAALFAAKAILDSGLPLRRRIRVIFGCDEESGFGCVRHYWEVAKEERPVYAFTPDASFPMVYAEKGMSNVTIERSVDRSGAPLRVTGARCGLRANMVPDAAEARVEGDPQALYGALAALTRYWDRNVSVQADGRGFRVLAAGRSAHGSTPQVGDNAAGRLTRALLELELPADRAWLEWAARTCDPTGAALGIEGKDDVAGPLTCNLGVLEAGIDSVRITYNIRYPVTWTFDDLMGRARPIIEAAGWLLVNSTNSPPLHAPLDQEPAKTLLRVYQEETGDTESRPETMGGGTYARSTPNAVAFGPSFPEGTDGPPHEPDERIAIDTLVRAAKIYAHALYELSK